MLMTVANEIARARDTAVLAVREAGEVLKRHFGSVLRVEEKGQDGDVVTEADHLSEAVLLQAIRNAFPLHGVHSEESGSNGLESDWLWMVDPLDGTNNYAIGLPVFSVSLALMYRSQPVLGVVYEPMTDRLFVSARGEGAFCNGSRLQTRFRPDLRKGTVGWIQGHVVQRDPRAAKLRQTLDLNVKRLMRLWAPTLQWGMLAKGDIDGIVLFNSEGDDLYAGVLMVKEAGGVVVDFEGRDFIGMCAERT